MPEEPGRQINKRRNMEDKKLKKKLAKIPDADKNGDPIFKIAEADSPKEKIKNKDDNGEKRKLKAR